MASVYPGAYDNLSSAVNPTLTHRNVAEAIEAVQQALGTKLSKARPVGEITMFPNVGNIPNGWLLCDGAAVSRTTYASLFAITNTHYGTGDGSTTFNLPNYKGRSPVGLDPDDTWFSTANGITGGEKMHTMTIAEMPNHNHNGYTPGNARVSGIQRVMNGAGGGMATNHTVGYGGGIQADIGDGGEIVTSGAHWHVISAQGGGGAFNVMHPYLVTRFIIYTGVYS